MNNLRKYEMFYCFYDNSPLGRLLLASDGKNLTGVWFEKQKYYAAALPENSVENKELTLFKQTANWLDCYFKKQNPLCSDLPLAPYGNNFRQCVWRILQEIPYGQVITYGALAKEVCRRLNKTSMSAQAVGGAVGHNPISIIIPCHRVVGANGSLTGYAGGLDIKTHLLALEGVGFINNNYVDIKNIKGLS